MTLNTYALVPSVFRHGTVAVELAVAPDLDALVTDETDPERIPYWAVLWHSAPVLAGWLLDRKDWREVEVLELGCGTGLVGLALTAAGARVLQTDLFPEAAALARSNAQRNHLVSVRHAVADWRHWPFHQHWPVIVASDVLYERRSHASLLEVLQKCLSPGGTAYLADPGRPMSAAFLALAEAAGWDVQATAPSGDIRVLELCYPG